MSKLEQEAFKAVDNINSTVIDKVDNDYLLQFESNGYCSLVTWLGICIWCSEVDEREFNEKTGKNECMQQYFLKQIRIIKKKMSELF